MSLSAPGQFDRARQAARRAVDAAPATRWSGWSPSPTSATLVVPPTTDRGGVLAAIDAARPGPAARAFAPRSGEPPKRSAPPRDASSS